MNSIYWAIAPTEIARNDKVVVMMTGAAPFTPYTLICVAPNCEKIKFRITTNGDGNIEADIYLTSGAGKYEFFWECNKYGTELSPSSITVTATQIAPTATDGSISIQANKQKYRVGEIATVVVHASMGRPVLLMCDDVTQVCHPDLTGAAQFPVIANTPGVLKLHAAQGTATASCSVHVIKPELYDAFILADTISCSECVVVSVAASKYTVGHIEKFNVTVSLCNRNPQDSVIANIPTMTGIPGFPGIVDLKLEPTQCVEVVYPCVISNYAIEDLQHTISGTGTYQCGGQTYPLAIQQTNVTVRGQSPIGDLYIDEFYVTPGMVDKNATATLKVKVRNGTNAPLTNVTLQSVTAPTNAAAGALEFSGINLAAGQTYVHEWQVRGVNSASTIIGGQFRIESKSLRATGPNGTLYEEVPKIANFSVRA